LLMASGKPHIVLRYQLLMLAPYLFLAIWLIGKFGATGAAIAWTLRVAVECGLLLAEVRLRYFVSSPVPQVANSHWLIVLSVALLPSLVCTSASAPEGVRIAVGLISLGAYAILAFRLLLTRDEQTWLVRTVRLNTYV
jgi:O-antigen/teichoic acid export membrane protein